MFPLKMIEIYCFLMTRNFRLTSMCRIQEFLKYDKWLYGNIYCSIYADKLIQKSII